MVLSANKTKIHIIQTQSRNFIKFETANISSTKFLKMDRIQFFVIIALLMLITSGANAQNTFSDMQSEVDRWKSSALTTDGIPPKAKQKKIKYESYTLEAFFVKDALVLGQTISIIDAAKHALLSGKVLSVETPVSVHGVAYDANGTEKLGVFEISNTSEGLFSFKPRKSEGLTIKCTSLLYVIALDANNPVIIDAQGKTLVSRDESSRNGYESLSADLPTSIQLDGQVTAGSILSSLSNNIRIQWEDRLFEGKVKAKGSSPVRFTTLTGTCTYVNGKTVAVARSGSNLAMAITDPSGNTENYVLPASNLDEEVWWSEKEFIKAAAAYQKQLEETTLSASRATSSSQKLSSDSNVGKSSASGTSSDNSDSEGNSLFTFLVIAAIILAPILYIRHLIHARDCSHCGKKFAMVDTDKQFMGTAYEKREKQSDGKYVNIHRNKYKIVRKCRYCGYEDYIMTEETG